MWVTDTPAKVRTIADSRLPEPTYLSFNRANQMINRTGFERASASSATSADQPNEASPAATENPAPDELILYHRYKIRGGAGVAKSACRSVARVRLPSAVRSAFPFPTAPAVPYIGREWPRHPKGPYVKRLLVIGLLVAGAAGCSGSTDATRPQSPEKTESRPSIPLNAEQHPFPKRRYDQVVFLVTHNSMSNRADGWLFPNQNTRIRKQLEDGVDGLMLDVHLVDGQPYLAHGQAWLGKQRLVDGLWEIARFLKEHPTAVITIIFESYVASEVIRTAFEAAGLIEQLHRQQPADPWPTLEQMRSAKRRLVVFTDREGGQWPGYHDVWNFCWETHFSVRRVEDFRYDRNRGPATARLLILNHFLTRTVGSVSLAIQANSETVLGPRVSNCLDKTGHLPNFVVVDFYDVGDAREVVNRFNRRTIIAPDRDASRATTRD